MLRHLHGCIEQACGLPRVVPRRDQLLHAGQAAAENELHAAQADGIAQVLRTMQADRLFAEGDGSSVLADVIEEHA